MRLASLEYIEHVGGEDLAGVFYDASVWVGYVLDGRGVSVFRRRVRGLVCAN